MKTILFLILALLISSCTKKQVSGVKLENSNILTRQNELFLTEVGKKLNSVSDKELKNIQALKTIEKSELLLSKRDLTKGDRYSAIALQERLKLFGQNIEDSKIKSIINQKNVQLKNVLDGKLNVSTSNLLDIKFPDKPFTNTFQIPPVKNKKSIPVNVESNLSYFKSALAWVKSENTAYECSGITLSNPDPSGSSLSATDYLSRRTVSLVDLSNQLGSPDKIFKYVRDEIKPWPSFGATQSANQVVQSKVGTFIDKANLLVTLLRAKGVPAQYLLGDILVSETKLKGIFGVEGSYDLFWVLVDSLNEYWDKSGKGTIFYRDGERTWLIPHAWVRAYINGQWVELDPSNIYYDFGISSQIFKQFKLNVDLNRYLLGVNQRGQYEKSGTILDFVLETAGDQIREIFGAGANIRDLDLAHFGRAIVPETEDLPTGTMGYNGSGCVFNQVDLIPINYQSKYSLKVMKGSSVAFDKSWGLPEFFEKGLITRHSSGLLGRVGDQAGTMNIYLGDDLVGSVDARTTETLAIDYSLEYFPTAYGSSFPKLDVNNHFIKSAGDVYAFMAYNSPTSISNLEYEIQKLKSLISQKVEEAKVYAQFLRVANVLTVLQEHEQNNVNQILNSTGVNSRGIFYTYGQGGIVRDRTDRPYGAVPLGTGINWNSGDNIFSRTGNYTDFSDYTNITQFSLFGILVGSQIEANIWEMLYGVPGGSSTKLMQLLARDIFVDGKENILVANQQLGVGRDAEILAMFDDEMATPISSDVNDLKQGYVKYKSVLYSHKKKYVRDNGYKGIAYLILPTDPRAGSTASYSGVAPAFGGIGPMGGGAIAEEVDAITQPTNVDANDPERKGAAGSCNPVSYSTGDMYHEFTDFVIAGRTPGSALAFERKYTTKSFKPLGDLGPDWTHNFQTRLISEGFDVLRPELTTNIIWIKEGGNKVVFSRNTDGTFTAPVGVNDQLTENASDFTIKRKGGNFYSYAKNKTGVINGRLLYFEEVHGERITLNYDFNKRLQSVESPFAGSISFNYDSSGRIISIHRDRDNLTYSFTYNTDGYLATSADFDNNQTKYEYVKDRPSTKAQNLLSKIIDPLNQEISFEYYDDGRVFEEVGKSGAKSTYFYSYFLVDQLTRMRGENGATKLYKFDEQYRLIETEYEDGSRIKQAWDADSNMSSSFDELGYETKFVYDKKGNRIGIKAPEHSGFIRTEYHPDFDKPTKVIPLVGAITLNTYDSSTGDLLRTEKQDSLGSVFLEFSNDQFGNVTTIRNNYVSYSDKRDSNGFLTEKYDTRNPINLEYDLRGRVKRKTYASGKIIDFEYDNFDRVTKIVNNVGPDVINQYDVLGRLTARTITDGATSKTTRYEYDSRDRQVAVIDPLGRRTEKKYDIPGLGCKYVIDKPIEIVDPKGRSTKLSYDNRNRLVRSVSPDGTVTRKEYNDRGDLVGITDGSGNRTSFLYDGNRRLIKKERASSKSTNNGEAKASKEITTYKYDEADRIVREEMLLPEERNGTEVAMLVTEYSYDELGNQISKTIKKEFMGQVDELDKATFVYRRTLDAPVQLQANNQNSNLDFLFENTPPFTMTGFKVKAAVSNNPLQLIEGDYAITPDISGQIGTLDKSGLSNSLFENEYDVEGRLTKKTSRFNGHRLTTNIAYDSYGRKKTVSHDSGLSGSFSYDSLDRLTSISWSGEGENFQESLSYDLLTGNITNIQREIGNFDYTYDNNDQLIKVNYTGGSDLGSLVNRDLNYDRAGNRISDTISGNGTFIRNVITENSGYRYYSDPNGFGNIIQKTNKQTGEIHIYDYLTDGKIRKFTKYERLPSSTQTMIVDYYYDALGRRIAKKIKTPSREFTQAFSYLADEDKILLTKNGNNEVQMEVDGQGIDEHFAEIKLAGAKIFISDHLGTIINGDIVATKKSTGVFGETLSNVNQNEQTSNPTLYGYAGRQFDSETGYYYYRNRYYDPQSGRFLSKDPNGIGGGDVNLYRYVSNSPLMSIDPYGENAVDGTIVFVIGAATTVVSATAKNTNMFVKVAGVAAGAGAMGTGLLLFIQPASTAENSDVVPKPGMGDLRIMERHKCP